MLQIHRDLPAYLCPNDVISRRVSMASNTFIINTSPVSFISRSSRPNRTGSAKGQHPSYTKIRAKKVKKITGQAA
ncbi:MULTISPECIES: hypothetical protein [Thermobacillus]|jgi:hypothetical protein|uniref:hypothetical protein n=1 Tax=Thermobacillus TaxID=76632 RepID=UPI001BD06414|nr:MULTISPECIES: hypothetical protein [Thermobacillus]